MSNLKGAYISVESIKNSIFKKRLYNFKKISNKEKILTILITNWKRVDFLENLLKKIINSSDLITLVISCSIYSKKLEKILLEYEKYFDDYTFIISETDHGCNMCWLNGLKNVFTKYVHIVHDDDLIVPNYNDILLNKFLPYKDKNIDLVFSNGLAINYETNSVVWKGNYDEIIFQLNMKEGIYNEKYIDIFLKTYSNVDFVWPISPVTQIYRTDIAYQTLIECNNNFIDREYFSKPTMMLGNEIMMTLRSLQYIK